MKSRNGFVRVCMGLVLALMVAGVSGCGKSREPGRYYSDKGFSIRPPDGWEQKAVIKQADMCFVKASDAESGLMLNVVSREVRRGTDVGDVFQVCLANCESNIPNFQKNAEGDAILDGQAAKWAVFSGRTGEVTVKFLAYVTVRGELGCVITCTAPADTFDQFRPQFEETAKSLRFE